MTMFKDSLILGAEAPGFLRGKGGQDRILGGHANDVLSGGGGNDYVDGADGRDYMRGGNGDDRLYGGLGNDVLMGGSGADFLCGDSGSDTLHGGRGADIFAFDVGGSGLGSGVDRVSDFMVGVDKLEIIGGSSANVTFTDEGANLGVYYSGVKIAVLFGVGTIPGDTSIFFGDTILT